MEVAELGEYTEGSLSERAETYALKTFGRIFSISRQAIVNDDLQAMTDLAQSFGQAGARIESDTVYSLITTNGNMSDGNPIFDAAHSNVGSAASLSVDSLGEARALMRKQTGLQGLGHLNLRPRYLIVPAALETKAEQLLASLVDPAKSNDTQNPAWIRSLELVVDARLDDTDTNAFYLAASPMQVDTVEVGYLDGQRGVFTETEQGFDIDGMRLKARLEFNALVVDWRGLVYNAGSS